jgi:excisionase family DNA binding protein
MESLLTSREVAKILSVSEPTVRGLAKRGEIPCIRLGNLYRFSQTALARYFDEAGQGMDRRETCHKTAESTSGQTAGTGGDVGLTKKGKRLESLLKSA